MKKSLKKLALLSMSAMTLGAVAVNTVALAEDNSEAAATSENTETPAEETSHVEESSVAAEASVEAESAESAAESASEEASVVEESAEAAQESAAVPAVATEEEASALQKAVKTSVETFRQTYPDVSVTKVSVEQLDGLDQAVQNAETAISEVAEGEEVDTSVNENVFKIQVEGRDETTEYSLTYHSETQEVLEEETEELDAEDQAEAIEALEFDNLLSFDKLTAIAIETAGYGQAIEWDLERDLNPEDKTTVDIEVVEDITDPSKGRKAEITIDAVTGEVIKTEGEVVKPVQPAATTATEQASSEEASAESAAESASEEASQAESEASEAKEEADSASEEAESASESASN
ncbi:PepSY domain-containing protein [Hutsoniella sourekii]|uniref:PepSY domain-containing protein n=1 Tax=Hutsoniella sourekii TaxID=87650 RepID=UPI00048512A1|nr:PepSY domain-containing protein [Hutsoniella sourekii]